MAQPLPAAPTPASPVPVHAAAFGTGDQEGNQEHDAFQLKDPLLGHVISKVQTVPSAPPPEESIFDDVEAWSTEHHHGKQGQEFHDQVFQLRDTSMPSSTHVAGQTLPPAPIPESSIASNTAAGSQGHHHSNQRQQKLLSQRMTFGGRGSKTGQFMSPTGVTVSNDFLISEIFVADRKNKRIQVFNLQGTFVRQFPTVMYPHDVAATDGKESEDIDLWVVGNTESADIAVQYNTQGRLLRKFALQDTGYTRGVAVDTRRNQILITSTTGDLFDKHGKVDVFKPDGSVVATVGCENGMKVPQYITVDCHSTGNIIVSDFEDNCVCVYSGDGQFLFKFGRRGRGEGLLKGPMGICTDWLGNIIVADSWNGRVELFDETGIFLHHITTDMQGPQAIAIAPEGQLVMTDSVNNTVTVFNNY
ncbi:protein meiotic P26-like [Branchiostoma floridae x Branchiostoma belcheri]